MKVVILAGGKGTRLVEETSVRPKPMVEIGGQPILWHLMKLYASHGLTDFVVCCGHKGNVIKEYFATYGLRNADVTFDFRSGDTIYHANAVEPWRVTLADTGEETMTGGRLRRIAKYVGGETFCCTYGDGLSDVDLTELIAFHRRQRRLATLTAVQPPGRFGAFTLSNDETLIGDFREKPRGDGAWVNGGFFVLEPEVFNYIDGDATVWEQEPMRRLSEEGQLSAFRHEGFWQSMDTLRDMLLLQDVFQRGNPPWLAKMPPVVTPLDTVRILGVAS
ncbi:glucose-1-phosphate cytidylyltransferase [Aquabacter sp. CN5-332]|uniref:glucose-1-phosphate cytidylyltransferase n=1 Tax=Aquabacter sp. CN5-332 TaxID=3156608 RepID=UPI0032B6084B